MGVLIFPKSKRIPLPVNCYGRDGWIIQDHWILPAEAIKAGTIGDAFTRFPGGWERRNGGEFAPTEYDVAGTVGRFLQPPSKKATPALDTGILTDNGSYLIRLIRHGDTLTGIQDNYAKMAAKLGLHLYAPTFDGGPLLLLADRRNEVAGCIMPHRIRKYRDIMRNALDLEWAC